MNTNIKRIYEPCFLQSGFYLDDHNTDFSKDMNCYTLSSEKGKGHYWVYIHKNMFSISIRDFVYYEDFLLEYPQLKSISITYFDSVSGEEFTPYKRLSSGIIRGHIGYDNSLYQALFHKNIPIRSVGIEIMPDYYENYLQTKYPREFKDPRSAFLSVDGSTHFPELILMMKQIKNFRGSGISAKLYYESKVSEAISLIFEKTKREQKIKVCMNICEEDLQSLRNVASYIDDHFAFPIPLEQLARIACMGTTKLKYTFKQVYKCTLSQYILNKKMSHAEHLLSHTDLSIQQISQIVGYKRASSFSQSFSKNTGLLPRNYRNMSKNKI